MIHVDKSKSLPGRPKAGEADPKSAKQALKGKSLADQEQALKPPAAPPLVVKPPAPAPVKAPESPDAGQVTEETRALETPKAPGAPQGKDAGAPEKPIDHDPDQERAKGPEVAAGGGGKDPNDRKGGDKKEPEDKPDPVEEKEPEKKDEKKEDKKEPEKPKEPSKKELRAKANALKRDQQIANTDKVRNERAEKREQSKPSERDQRINEKAREYETQRPKDQVAWEETVKAQNERQQLRITADNLLLRVTGLDDDLKQALKVDFKAEVEKIISAFSGKATNDRLSKAITKATNALDNAITEAHVAPRGEVTSAVSTLDSGGHLTEALRYTGARKLARVHGELNTAMNENKWFVAKLRLEEVKGCLEEMKPLMAMVSFWQPKVTWTTGKTLANKKGAPVERYAATLRDQAVDKLANRYTLGPNGLTALDKWFKTEYEPFVQIPLTCSLWSTVKDSDTDSVVLLDQLLTAGLISGVYASKYTTSYDTGGGYSLEYTVRGIDKIVLHTHCDSSGTPKEGENASHWKAKGSKKDKGGTHPVSKALMQRFMK